MTRLRPRALGALAIAAVLLTGCATKRDVRTLRDQMQAIQQQQAEVLRDIQQQNRLLLDSIRATMTLTQDVRGATAAQLRQFEQNVSQLGGLVSQIMGTLNRIEQRIDALERRPATAGGSVTGGGDALEYYDAGVQSMSADRFGAARAAFEQLVAEFPTHEKAPDAQFQIGESYYREKAFANAYAELEKVAQRWPDSPRAREALIRAGAIAEEQKDLPKARTYYTRVRDNYRGTDEARHAERRLTAIRR